MTRMMWILSWESRANLLGMRSSTRQRSGRASRSRTGACSTRFEQGQEDLSAGEMGTCPSLLISGKPGLGKAYCSNNDVMIPPFLRFLVMTEGYVVALNERMDGPHL